VAATDSTDPALYRANGTVYDTLLITTAKRTSSPACSWMPLGFVSPGACPIGIISRLTRPQPQPTRKACWRN